MPARTIRLAAVGLIAAWGACALAAAPEPTDPWPDLVRDAFDGRPMAEGTGLIAIEMPTRAEDAAIVPVTLWLNLPLGDARSVKAVTLVIDQNPAPVAARFDIGPTVTMISTRVRVDSYTNVHAVAELSDGTLHVTKTFIKASGGCSAPAAKNADEARKTLGLMRLRQFSADRDAASGLREAQIMVRHPNNSGLQMDQVTRLYTPAFFVRDIRVWQGDELLLRMDGGISMSEDPNIRFSYRPNGAATLRAEATDTDGNRFSREWPVEETRANDERRGAEDAGIVKQ
jgi:sulfur-oxidizing protein SoxY